MRSLSSRVVITVMLTLAAASVQSAQAASVYFKGGVPVVSAPLPSSYQQAVDEGFYFIFDSMYEQGSTGTWSGEFINFQYYIVGIPVSFSCRLQAGAYIWEEEHSPDAIRIALTHTSLRKSTPPGLPGNDSSCSKNMMQHNNGFIAYPGFPSPQSDGAWGIQVTPTAPSGPVPTDIKNVQYLILSSGCSSAPGNSGSLTVTYSDNGAGNRLSYTSNDTIDPPSVLDCNLNGELYSVDSPGIYDPDHTPTTPTLSPASIGVIDYIL